MAEMERQPADRYEFNSADQSIAGDVTVTASDGNVGSLVVDGMTVRELTVERPVSGGSRLGWAVSGYVDAAPDLHTRTVTVVLPEVNVDGAVESFAGLAIVVTHRTSIGGPQLVKGALQEYDDRVIAGTARREEAA